MLRKSERLKLQEKEKDDILEKGFLFAVKEKIPCKKNGIRYYMNGEKMA